ncbi:hypothetical protein PUNSTDRAFT_137997, partial [Punctularia strigosozonata HHB-11173 SS5]
MPITRVQEQATPTVLTNYLVSMQAFKAIAKHIWRSLTRWVKPFAVDPHLPERTPLADNETTPLLAQAERSSLPQYIRVLFPQRPKKVNHIEVHITTTVKFVPEYQTRPPRASPYQPIEAADLFLRTPPLCLQFVALNPWLHGPRIFFLLDGPPFATNLLQPGNVIRLRLMFGNKIMAASACISYILEEKVGDYIIYVTRLHKRYRSHDNIFGQMADAYYRIAASRSRMPVDSGVGYLVVVAKYGDNKREPQLPPIKKEYGPLPFGCPVATAKLVVATN